MFSHLPTTLCLSILASLALSAETTCTTTTLTIHAWPLSSPSATPLASILETSCPSTPKTYSLRDWTPPPHESPEYKLVRVGHFTSDTSSTDSFDNWDGIVTSAASFAPGRAKTLTLLADGAGNVVHVDFGASQRTLKAGTSLRDEVSVAVRHPTPGTEPVLNKPIVLDESGKLKTDEKEEKTFLQKYWWVIGLFLVMQVVSAGSKE